MILPALVDTFRKEKMVPDAAGAMDDLRGYDTLHPMGRAAPLPPPGFDDMSVEDRIDYVQALWDRIAANEAQVPVPDWHRKVLEERLADQRANPAGGRPWEEVEADLLKRRR